MGISRGRRWRELARSSPSLQGTHPWLSSRASTQDQETAKPIWKPVLPKEAIPHQPLRAFPVIQVEDLATLTARQDPGKFGAWVLLFFSVEGLAGVTPLRLLQCWIPAAGKRQECTCHLLQQRVLRGSCNVKLRPRSWGGRKKGGKRKKNRVPPG